MKTKLYGFHTLHLFLRPLSRWGHVGRGCATNIAVVTLISKVNVPSANQPANVSYVCIQSYTHDNTFLMCDETSTTPLSQVGICEMICFYFFMWNKRWRYDDLFCDKPTEREKTNTGRTGRWPFAFGVLFLSCER